MQNSLFEAICRVGIFMICVRAILHFRPQEVYEKYLRLLAGIMILIQLFLPVGRFLLGKGGQEAAEVLEQFRRQLEQGMEDAVENAAEADALLEQMTLEEVQRRLEEQQEAAEQEGRNAPQGSAGQEGRNAPQGSAGQEGRNALQGSTGQEGRNVPQENAEQEGWNAPQGSAGQEMPQADKAQEEDIEQGNTVRGDGTDMENTGLEGEEEIAVKVEPVEPVIINPVKPETRKD